MLFKNLIGLFLFLLASFCQAGTIDPETPDQKYLEYGEKFYSVVQVSGVDNSGSMYFASAVLIDDYNFLTAAHVVKDSKICRIKIEDGIFLIEKIIVHHTFSESFGNGDIAIGHSVKPFKLDYYPPLYTDKDFDGKLCSMAGYGYYGDFKTGANKIDKKKRAGSNVVDYTHKDLIICSPSHRKTKGYTSLEYLIAFGDSGGGLFIDGKLAGIHSCIMSVKGQPSAKYGEESGHTNVSKFISWIEKNKKK
jgi:hypothetical protein